jgi:hypothetical protein
MVWRTLPSSRWGGACRAQLGEIGDSAQGRLRDQAILPPAMGAGFAKKPIQGGIGQGGQQAISKEKARLEKAALR